LLNLDYHDIISVQTQTIYSTSPNVNLRKQGERIKGKGKTQPGKKNLPKGDSFGMALLRVIAVLVIMGLLYFGWTAYRVQHGDQWIK
jgi:hypothetical protein